jgi:hypothetical protein
MKNRTLVTVAIALLVGAAMVATTGIAVGSSDGKAGGCKNFEWGGTSTARNFDNQTFTYTEDGVVTKGFTNATYHLSGAVTFAGPFATNTGPITVDAGNGNTVVMQNHGAVRGNASGPVPFGGAAFFAGGTGTFAGATGDLALTGTYNLDFGQPVTRVYVGQLCLP